MLKEKNRISELIERYTGIKAELDEIGIEEQKLFDDIKHHEELIIVAKKELENAGNISLEEYEALDLKLHFLIDQKNKHQNRLAEIQLKRSQLALSRRGVFMKIWTLQMREQSAALRNKFEPEFMRLLAFGSLARAGQFSQIIDQIIPLRDRKLIAKVKKMKQSILDDFDNGLLKE